MEITENTHDIQVIGRATISTLIGATIPTAANPLKINVVITSAKINAVEQTDDYRLKLPKNATTVLIFELRLDDGSILPLSGEEGHFSVPLQRLSGEVIDSLEIQFTNGIATLTETWHQSGEFKITQEMLNTYIDNDQQIFIFPGVAFSVYRPGAIT